VVGRASRRALLGGAAVAALPVALTACGSDGGGHGKALTDAGVLEDPLKVERFGAFAYPQLAPRLADGEAVMLGRMAAHHAAHVKRLEALIRGVGAAPDPPEQFTPPPPATDRVSIWSYVGGLERRQVSSLQLAIARVSHRDLRAPLAQILAVQGEQLAVVRRALREDPLDHPFDNGDQL
jgi:hypothetical protein